MSSILALLSFVLARNLAKSSFEPVIEIRAQNLQPETLLYDDENGWLVSSKGYGGIYRLVESDDADYYTVETFFNTDRFLSGTGFRLKDDILYACNVNPTAQGQFLAGADTPTPANLTTSSLFIVNTITGTFEELSLDDAPILDNSTNYMHFCNDIVIDDAGDLYITDSFQGVVYKLENNTRNFTIGAQNDDWPLAQSFACNGITLSDDGEFLMITIYHDSTIWKIPLTDMVPRQVNMDVQNLITGFDGQQFSTDGKTLYTIHNQAHVLYEWETDNNWDNVTLSNTWSCRYGGCTSVEVIKGRKYPYIADAFLGVNQTNYYLEEAAFVSSKSCSSSNRKSAVIGLSVGLSIAGVIAIIAILLIVRRRGQSSGGDYNQF